MKSWRENIPCKGYSMGKGYGPEKEGWDPRSIETPNTSIRQDWAHQAGLSAGLFIDSYFYLKRDGGGLTAFIVRGWVC